MSILSISLTLFLLMDPFGNIPLFLAQLSPFDAKKRRNILIREMCIALAVILIFQWIGEFALNLLGIENTSLYISGGIILFIIALKMIFNSYVNEKTSDQEPFIVPLAIPMIAGPAILAAVTILAHQHGIFSVSLSTLIAWALSGIILLSSTFFQKFLKVKGLLALEKLMGLILTLLAIQMIMQGIRLFVRYL